MRSKTANQTGSKEYILAQIRTALGGHASPVAPEPLPPFSIPHAPCESAEVVSQFTRELENVGGRITSVQTIREIRELLQRLFPKDEFVSVAVSNGEVLRRLGIREWLVSDNRQIVPSLGEFMLAGRQGMEIHSQQDSLPGENEKLSDEYNHVLIEASLGITSADYALADTGTLVLVSGGEQHRLISLLPPAHVCLLDPRRIFSSLTGLLAHMRVAYDAHGLLPLSLTCITGPSRTADIEQTITMGVHGPRTLDVILYASTEIE